VDRSNIQNKLASLSRETKLKFNIGMHGFSKDAEVRYGSLSDDKQRLIRRRLSDNDNSVEIVNTVPAITSVPKEDIKTKTKRNLREVAEPIKGDD
jgi:hypothetical protein